MPTKRCRVNRTQKTRITAEVVAAYRAGDETELHRLLRLPPWQISPLEAEGECPYSRNAAGNGTWQDSVDLREALENAD
ncbi:MAG: hypothetical protein DRQ56_06755 [Gammaproteobacteria bacterium]|nr:MAG: hypothetical protein DRQ56_06755 [Gammaproteobacteria bacterium]